MATQKTLTQEKVSASDEAGADKPVDLKNPEYYTNRELSWLAFNRRVLEEALDQNNPLLERIKFTAILSNNLDEFFMTRVAGLWSQVDAGVVDLPPDGMSPIEQLDAIRIQAMEMLALQRTNYHDHLIPALAQQGIRILSLEELKSKQQKAVHKYFREAIFAVLTPLGVDPGRPFPFISNLSLNLAVSLQDSEGHQRFARVKIPTGVLPRLVALRTIMEYLDRDFTGVENTFIFLEDIIAANLDALFPGMTILESHTFRVTRDADMEIAEEEASDLLETIETGLRQRAFGQVTRLTVANTMPETLRKPIMEHLKISKSRVYEVSAPLGMTDLMKLYTNADAPLLRDPSFAPRRSNILAPGTAIFSAIQEHDILLHHPYDAFSPVVDLIETAARDPKVLAIKCTLYRLGANSPIVDALLEARQNGKQVSALVELKARFDEENNITWARALEAQGVHVIYGFFGLKTHSKVVLIIREENDGLKRYVHLSTGNYNPTTARVYTDLSLLTSNKEITHDASLLFNRLTGFAPGTEYSKLIVAPEYMRNGLTSLIDREIEHVRAGRPAKLTFKTNALVDARLIRKLYQASMAGIKIDLIVRGICCLKPGIEGISENIRVVSIVGRFLEHSRIYYFENGGDDEIYLGSADLMPRNLDRRVETLFPVESPALKIEILEVILAKQLADNVKARILQPDGAYVRRHAENGSKPFDSQRWFIEQTKTSI